MVADLLPIANYYLIIGMHSISDFSLNQLRTRDMNTYNGVANGLWSDGYRAINMTNIVLKFLPVHQSQDENKARILKGECLFMNLYVILDIRMFALPAGFTSDNSHQNSY